MFLNPNIRIGCSGWQYTHWRGDFYPAELSQTQWLTYYAQRFDTVEINNTFYRLPEAATFASWGRRAPRGFVFAVKASRYLTHMKKLKDPADPIRLFFTRARRLEHALGPVLYQLPPRWPVNLERLETFLKALPRTRQHTIEFREPSWYNGDVYRLLERHKVTLCLHDMAGSASEKLAIGPFVYVDFTGRRNTAAATPTRRSTRGPTGSRRALPKDVRSTRTSTTTQAATRRGMRYGCEPRCCSALAERRDACAPGSRRGQVGRAGRVGLQVEHCLTYPTYPTYATYPTTNRPARPARPTWPARPLECPSYANG